MKTLRGLIGMQQPKRLEEVIVELPFRCAECDEPYLETAGNIYKNHLAVCCGKTIHLLSGENMLPAMKAVVAALEQFEASKMNPDAERGPSNLEGAG
jgi:hypothetical protein